MKRGFILINVFIFTILINLVSSAATCDLDATLINQDPRPAVPGDYVELLFQLKGLENFDCENIYFELVGRYPISFDPGVDSIITVKAGTYTKNFNSNLVVPYKVRVDSDALDGNTPLEVRYGSSKSTSYVFPESFLTEEFDLNVKDVRTDFEIFIKNYDPKTNTLTFEILNIGKSDVEALTLEILEQSNIIIKGSSRNIIGSLDSNDFSTAEFEAIPEAGNVDLIIYYTDEINVRRSINKTVSFFPEYFKDRSSDEKSNLTLYLIIFVIIVGVAYYFYRRRKHENRKKLLHH